MHVEIVWPAWLIGILLYVVFFSLMLRAGRRHRFLVDMPTSKTRGVYIGQVELHGKAKLGHPLRSRLAEVPCVWYRYTIKEEWSRWETETYTDKDGKTRTRQVRRTGWTTIDNGGEAPVFSLEDDAGAIQVRPDGAEMEASAVFNELARVGEPLYTSKTRHSGISDSTGHRRFFEEAIPQEAEVFIAGYAQERSDVVAPEIATNEGQELYLISCKGEAKIQGRYRLQFWLFGLLSLAVLPLAGVVQAQSTQSIPGAIEASAVAALLAWVGGWTWMAFNSLVRLKNRTAQAWSLIEIQLKRRADLLPRLVSTVQSLKNHEGTLQTELATLRTQSMASPKGLPGPDIEGSRAVIQVILEKYPELSAESGFLSLQKEVSDTETRIALARDFYNSTVTHLNTRLETIPDRWLAPFAGLKRTELLVAAGFEREPVKVNLGDAPT